MKNENVVRSNRKEDKKKMSQQSLQQILNKLSNIEYEQQSIKQEFQDFKLQTKNDFNSAKQEIHEFKLQTKNDFDKVKEDLRIIREQTAKIPNYPL